MIVIPYGFPINILHMRYFDIVSNFDNLNLDNIPRGGYHAIGNH